MIGSEARPVRVRSRREYSTQSVQQRSIRVGHARFGAVFGQNTPHPRPGGKAGADAAGSDRDPMFFAVGPNAALTL